jgi:type I restriction enzyme S subunit
MQVSVKNLSEASLHPDYRWDGEYLCFEPHRNNQIKYIPIGDTLKSSQYGLSIAMNEDGNGTKIYRMNEISNMMCDRNISKYAPITSEEVEAYKLNDRDVLFNRTNSQVFVGRTGIFKEFSQEPMVFASYLVRIVPDTNIVTPEYLATFLNTKYGVLDVKRRARISINQSNVNAEELKRVEIPLLKKDLQLLITNSFDEAFRYIQESESTFKEAENILLSELGLTHWQPKHQLTFIKNYSDTQQAERIDAEYYQPKYDEIIHAIKNYSGGWESLDNLVNLKDQNFNPKSDVEYNYIELSNIAGNGEITGCEIIFI